MMNRRKDGTLLLWNKEWGGNPNLTHVHLSESGAERIFAIYKPVREFYKQHIGSADKELEETLRILQATLRGLKPNHIEEEEMKAFREIAEKEFNKALNEKMKNARNEAIQMILEAAEKHGDDFKKHMKAQIQSRDPKVERTIQEIIKEKERNILKKRKEFIEKGLEAMIEYHEKRINGEL